MRSTRSIVGASIAALALLVSACGGGGGPQPAAKGTISVGGFNFSESTILANIYGKALKDQGYTVSYKLKLGNREIVAPALEKGEIDLYAGYAATDLEYYNNKAGEASGDVQATVAKLRQRLESKGLKALEPSSAIDQDVFAVTKATQTKYNLKKLSDLVPVANQLTLGGPAECPTRPYCAPGLKSKYGIEFKAFKALDAGGPITRDALERGDIQVGLLFSSDGAIKVKGFVVLDDDKHLEAADNVVPIIRASAAKDDVVSLLNRISAKLTTESLIDLNKRVDVDKEDPDAVAEKWLKDNGFLK